MSSLDDHYIVDCRASGTENITSLTTLQNKYKYISAALIQEIGSPVNTRLYRDGTTVLLQNFALDDGISRQIRLTRVTNNTEYWISVGRSSDTTLSVSDSSGALSSGYYMHILFHN